jgi:hypothetical protein
MLSHITLNTVLTDTATKQLTLSGYPSTLGRLTISDLNSFTSAPQFDMSDLPFSLNE